MINRIILVLFSFYKFLISPLLEVVFGKGCRFSPTCSDYAREAVEKYGAFVGLKMALKRLIRCHPLNANFHFDPVP